MKTAPLFIVAASVGLLAYAAWRPGAPDEATIDEPQFGFSSVAGGFGFDIPAIENYQVQSAMNDTTTAGQNLAAFLTMISVSEGTDRAADPYRVCFGYAHTVRDLAQHPADGGAAREWAGEKLSTAMCAGAGLGPGCVSTAAGRYQIIRPTWRACKKALNLPDFSAQSQDAACVYLLKSRGALDDVQAGRVEDAVRKCAKEWASLPGAGYGQGERKLSKLVSAFLNAGGNLA